MSKNFFIMGRFWAAQGLCQDVGPISLGGSGRQAQGGVQEVLESGALRRRVASPGNEADGRMKGRAAGQQ